MITFQNDGLINLSAVKTFGVSSKECDSPIGYFGTGLKYAIAILLRNNIDFTLYRGKKRIKFSVKSKKIRNDKFNIICMNGEELGFTTDVGKNWDLWQAFRELYCNCLDEGGTINTVGKAKGEAGKTIIVVKGPEFQKLYNERGTIVLSSAPLTKSCDLEIHQGASKHIFYRGIKALESSATTLFTYNILEHLTLTEDRTIKSSWNAEQVISDGIVMTQDEDILFQTLSPQEGSFEASINFAGVSQTPSQAFINVVSILELSRDPLINDSAIKFLRAYQRRTAPETIEVGLNCIELEQLEKAKNFCRSMGYDIDEFPILVVEHMDSDILGMAENGKILVAHRCFDLGTKFVAHAVLEEYIHLKEGLYDCSRALQSFLFKKIISLGEEHVLKEPL